MRSRKERRERVMLYYQRLKDRFIKRRMKRKELFKNHYENLKVFVANRRQIRLERLRRRYEAIVKLRQQQKESTLGKLIKCLSPHRRVIVFALLLGILGALARLASPVLIQKISAIIVDAARPGGKWDFYTINLYSGIAFALFFIGFAFDYLQAFVITGVTTKIGHELRQKLSVKINTLPISYFDSRNIGDILSYVTNDVDVVTNSTNLTLSNLTISLFTIAGTVIILFVYHWLLGLISLLCIPIGWLVMYLCSFKCQKAFTEEKALVGEMSSISEQSFAGIDIVQSFDAVELFKTQFADTNYDLEKCSSGANSLAGLLAPAVSLFGNILFILICFVCAYFAGKAGADSKFIAVLVAALTYAKQLIMPLTNIAQLVADFQQAIASASRIFTLLNEKSEPDEKNKTHQLAVVKGNVKFDHVRFGYNPNRIIIHDFNANIKVGQKIAIVGPTGAGKTTMVNLLMRFYEINGGKITIEGVDTTTMNRSYVRSLFGMVLQDTWLFEGTFMENLKFSRRTAKDEEVYEACKATHCDEFIKQAGGYDKLIKEDSGLSSGQKQLLTIARAMIQNAPMLILDEATSSVDTRTELLIQDAMDKLMKGRTSFVIAHRLSTIKNADMIIVMKDGDIVETGKHAELLIKNGLYAEIYNAQFSRNEN